MDSKQTITRQYIVRQQADDMWRIDEVIVLDGETYPATIVRDMRNYIATCEQANLLNHAYKQGRQDEREGKGTE